MVKSWVAVAFGSVVAVAACVDVCVGAVVGGMVADACAAMSVNWTNAVAAADVITAFTSTAVGVGAAVCPRLQLLKTVTANTNRATLIDLETLFILPPEFCHLRG
jgi:hypothetical protein